MAMETSRVALQNLGRLSFTQMTELVKCVARSASSLTRQLHDEPRPELVPRWR